MNATDIERRYQDYADAKANHDGFGRPEAVAYAVLRAALIIGKAIVAAALIRKAD